MRGTSKSIRLWAHTTIVTLEWETGAGDSRLRGWQGADGLRAIETNADTVWSNSEELDRPFDAYWDARSLSPEDKDGARDA